MKKYLVLVNDYPSENSLYANGFVHRRIKLYEHISNEKYDVFVLKGSSSKKAEYVFENIKVIKGSKKDLEDIIINNNYSKVLIHFINRHMIEVINKVNIPVLIWIHGSEALSWKRRLFNLRNENKMEFFKYIFKNERQLFNFRKFIDSNKNIKIIFVSKWMENIFKKDVKPKESITGKSYVIPNLIDDNLFKYSVKKDDQRFKFLSIRPHTSNKYANDIIVGAIEILSTHTEFSNLEFTLIGDGPNFEKNTNSLKKYENVKLQRRFLSQEEIASKHKEFGVLLCPTRQDSQGVSMCEGMSSGLVPISTYNTAIPEFVENGESGLLIEKNSSELLAEKILYISRNPNEFKKMSKNSASYIRSICSSELTIKRELKIINQ